MSTSPSNTIPIKQETPSPDSHTHVTTIDLPGETVQFWRSSSAVKVVLRKHRDVIFDLQLFKGMVYTVHAQQSEFDDAGRKKIVRVDERVTIKDGERAHLWVSREFRGSLILSANHKILGRYEPARLDLANHDALPTTKPAPLLIILHNAGTPWSGMASPDPTTPWTTQAQEISGRTVTDMRANVQIPQIVYPTLEQPSDETNQAAHVIGLHLAKT